MATVIAELMATLGLDASDFDKGIDKAESKGKGFGGAMSGLAAVGGGILTAGLTAAAGAATLLGVEITKDIGIAADAQKVQAQLNAVIKSTGGVAGVTAESANELATSLSKVTAFDDEAITSGESMLLTFTNIGKDVFPQATETILDMSQALGQDLKSSAIQLGKALNDPINGATALQRVGVTFTDQQKEQIKTMQESGDIMGAQQVILAELSKEFGGSAKAAGETFTGKMTILKNTMDNIRENIGNKFIPVLANLGEAFSKWLMQPEVQAFIDNLFSKLAEGARIVQMFLSFLLAGRPFDFFKVFEDGSSYVQSFLEMLGMNSDAAAKWAVTVETVTTKIAAAWSWFVTQLQTNHALVVSILAVLGAAFIAFGVSAAIAAATAIAPLLPVVAIIAAIGVAAYALAKAWETNWGGIREKTAAVITFVKNGVMGWVQLFTITIPNAINVLKAKWTNGFENIRTAIQKIIDFAQRLRDKLMSITLPAWLTPGSPTPFEIGLLGIADALKAVNSTGFNIGAPKEIALAAPSGVNRVANNTTAAQPKEVNYNIEINNPVGETSEKSQRKALVKLNYLGVAPS